MKTLAILSLAASFLPVLSSPARTSQTPGPQQARPPLAVGDSCYVTAHIVNLRAEPTAGSMSIRWFMHDNRLKVIEVPKKN